MSLPSRGTFLAFLGAVCLAFVIGRGTQKTVTVEKVREVEKQAEQKVEQAKAETATAKNEAAKVEWRTRTIYQKGEPVEVIREVVKERRVAEVETKVVEQKVEVEKVVYRDRLQVTAPPRPPNWAAGASVGLGLDGRLRYGGQLERRVLDPLWVTAGVDVPGRAATLGLRLEF